nr:MAG TPA: hypothetical protein [Caudoviricetes sp.]
MYLAVKRRIKRSVVYKQKPLQVVKPYRGEISKLPKWENLAMSVAFLDQMRLQR